MSDKKEMSWRQLHDKVKELSHLEEDWDSDGAPPPTPDACETAKNILLNLEDRQFKPSGIIASVEGGISIIWSNKNKYADLEIDNENEVVATLSLRPLKGSKPEIWKVKSLFNTLDRIFNFITKANTNLTE